MPFVVAQRGLLLFPSHTGSSHEDEGDAELEEEEYEDKGAGDEKKVEDEAWDEDPQHGGASVNGELPHEDVEIGAFGMSDSDTDPDENDEKRPELDDGENNGNDHQQLDPETKEAVALVATVRVGPGARNTSGTKPKRGHQDAGKAQATDNAKDGLEEDEDTAMESMATDLDGSILDSPRASTQFAAPSNHRSVQKLQRGDRVVVFHTDDMDYDDATFGIFVEHVNDAGLVRTQRNVGASTAGISRIQPDGHDTDHTRDVETRLLFPHARTALPLQPQSSTTPAPALNANIGSVPAPAPAPAPNANVGSAQDEMIQLLEPAGEYKSESTLAPATVTNSNQPNLLSQQPTVRESESVDVPPQHRSSSSQEDLKQPTQQLEGSGPDKQQRDAPSDAPAHSEGGHGEELVTRHNAIVAKPNDRGTEDQRKPNVPDGEASTAAADVLREATVHKTAVQPKDGTVAKAKANQLDNNQQLEGDQVDQADGQDLSEPVRVTDVNDTTNVGESERPKQNNEEQRKEKVEDEHEREPEQHAQLQREQTVQLYPASAADSPPPAADLGEDSAEDSAAVAGANSTAGPDSEANSEATAPPQNAKGRKQVEQVEEGADREERKEPGKPHHQHEDEEHDAEEEEEQSVDTNPQGNETPQVGDQADGWFHEKSDESDFISEEEEYGEEDESEFADLDEGAEVGVFPDEEFDPTTMRKGSNACVRNCV